MFGKQIMKNSRFQNIHLQETIFCKILCSFLQNKFVSKYPNQHYASETSYSLLDNIAHMVCCLVKLFSISIQDSPPPKLTSNITFMLQSMDLATVQSMLNQASTQGFVTEFYLQGISSGDALAYLKH